MKRITVFCDGTWNGADQAHPTNVRQMAMMVPSGGGDGIRQVTLYFQGVGVPEKGGWLERINEKISGGAMGWGLNDKIALAYMHLGRHYEPGDQVYIFGFSRGAYTARSLAGLIRNCGLPRNPSPELVRECFDLYRSKSDNAKPDAAESLAFRLRVSPQVTTSVDEVAFREANGHPPGVPFSVTYLGIWDTVGALGIPSYWGLPARILNRKYRFHDTDLSKMVHSARHAVAVDEMRRPFVPTLWTNLAKLRVDNPAGDYRQEWFAGNHGSVGGGGDIVCLSGLALAWIAQGAIAEGLKLDASAIGRVRSGCNLLGSLRNQSGGRSLGERLMGLTGKARKGPDEIGAVAGPTVARWRTDSFPPDWGGRPYRPKTLGEIENDLSTFDLAKIRDYSAISVA